MINKATGLKSYFYAVSFFKLSPKVSFPLSMCRRTMFQAAIQYRSRSYGYWHLNVQITHQISKTINECKYLSLKC